MQYQFFWPDWWKLWPQWESDRNYDEDFHFWWSDNYFFFGPLQVHWYGD